MLEIDQVNFHEIKLMLSCVPSALAQIFLVNLYATYCIVVSERLVFIFQRLFNQLPRRKP